MHTSRIKGFTIVEILICIAIFSLIFGAVLVMMTRGASNTQKGSFTALAANQAFWIVSTMRNDIARSDINRITFPSSGVWKGDTTFCVPIEGGTATYSVEKRGKSIIFVRKFAASNNNTAFTPYEDKVQRFGDEYLADMSVKLASGSNFLINIKFTEDGKAVSDKKSYEWNSTIYAPVPDGLSRFWFSTDSLF